MWPVTTSRATTTTTTTTTTTKTTFLDCDTIELNLVVVVVGGVEFVVAIVVNFVVALHVVTGHIIFSCGQ